MQITHAEKHKESKLQTIGFNRRRIGTLKHHKRLGALSITLPYVYDDSDPIHNFGGQQAYSRPVVASHCTAPLS